MNISSSPRRSVRSVALTAALASIALVLDASTTTRSASADALRTPANELLVEIEPGVSASGVVATLNGLLWHVVSSTTDVGTLPTGVAEVLRIAPTNSVAATLASATVTLGALSAVRTVEENVAFTTGGPYGGEQSEVPVFLDALTLADMGTQPAYLSAGLELPTTASGNAAVRVAVLDGGFDCGVEALSGRCDSGYDAIDHDSNPDDAGNSLDDDLDGSVDSGVGHGTAVASLIAVAAPEAEIVPIRVLDDESRGTSYDLASGILAARNRGADIINLSLGATTSSTIVENALAAARNNGILVVASAGNTDGTPTFPATSSHTIAITGVTSDGVRASYASLGPCVDAAAQSVDVIAPYPGTSTGYGHWSGTSFAAAIFSAAAARVLQSDPGDPLDAADALLNCLATFPSEAAPDSASMGGGILDASSLLD